MHLVRPFPYERLRQLTKRQVLLLERLSNWLANRSKWSGDGFESALGSSLDITVREILPTRAAGQLGEASQVIKLEHAGSRELAWLEVDSPFALELVWRCLSGTSDASMAAPRPLDRVEQGVLMYLASRAVCSMWSHDLPPPFRVAGIATDADRLRITEKGHGAIVHLELRAGPSWGHGWLHLSTSLADVIVTSTAFDTARIDAVSGLPTMLHVVMGRLELSAAQWSQVHLGDVVIIDEVWTTAPSEGELTGSVRLRLPFGRPRWTAALSTGGALSVDGLVDPAAGERMDQAHNQPSPTPEALLAEIPAEMSVELGRISLTAQEALTLRPGQTLRLARRPGDPVELRVGPNLVARGELVVVEGELGVLLREVFAGE